MNGVLGSDDFKQRYGVSKDDGKTMYLTPTTKSLFSSLAVIGALIGCFIPAFATNKSKCYTVCLSTLRGSCH